jgi:hypothetical protein
MHSLLQRFAAHLVALVTLIGASSAAALPVTWTFTGTLQVVNSPGPLPEAIVDLGVSVGAPVSGFIRFESTIPDVRPDPGSADYVGAIDMAGR